MNYHKLGAGLLSSGSVLVTLGTNKVAWWFGLAMLVVGPILMSSNQTPEK